MTRLRCVHLNDDFAMGGVVKALGIFDHPQLAGMVESRVQPVTPGWRLAPRLDADVIVTHFPPSWRALPFLASLRVRNPSAHLVHIEHSYTGAWEALCVPSRRRFRQLLRLSYRFFNDIVAVSQGQRDWLLGAGLVQPRRLHVLHPWSGAQNLDRVPLPDFMPNRPLRVGALGRFAWAKGFDVLIDAFASLDPGQFELRLGGMGPLESELRERAAKLEHVRFVGKVDDVAAFMAQCDVVVVPSRWEAFGQVAAEARMAGRPVIVADVDGLPEQVGRAGLVADCNTPETLVEAIRRLTRCDLPGMARAARASMANAETERAFAWRTLFQRITKTRAKAPRRGIGSEGNASNPV
ncbi:hypothetical protein B2G71_22000 [Novosphingobium sp. PC22D]|uniref:glycosyltransferase family 4 protein n=1 Tax=Novosphingobium sp. PC22D TaxID=1962403 RepID=UPI000BEFAEB0|nr:glycosyltransferase family 4 protein [Novosphingobium sp. PC22D]PEQ10502.1 hypothetical protein B2G71_22000 [Novosphingobium sp. PC22D]